MTKFKINTILATLFLIIFSYLGLMAENPFCARCDKAIVAQSAIKSGERYYHRKCFICDHCGKRLPIEPGEGWITVEDKYYHADCYYRHIKLRCYVCGEWIEEFYQTDYWGNAYHKSHIDSHPKCEYCGRFITQEVTNGGVMYADERVICNLCIESAVSDLEDAKTILGEVRDSMATIGIEIDLDNVRVRLLSVDQMKQRSNEHLGAGWGLTSSEYGNFAGKGESWAHMIYILYGMPRYTFISVLAHELMHVWLHENRDREAAYNYVASRTSIEGCCNYAAYLTLKKYAYDNVRYQLDGIDRNRNIHYGSGFREVKAFAAQNGVDKWLEAIKDHGRLPASAGN